MLSREMIEHLKKWEKSVDRSVSLTLIKTEDGRSKDLQSFSRELLAVSTKIHGDTVTSPDDSLPAFQLAPGWTFHGIPDDLDFRPFLEILALQDRSTDMDIESEIVSLCQNLYRPVPLTVFIDPGCPHCARLLFDLTPLPFLNTNLSIRVIDSSLFPEVAESQGVRSVPTVFLDERHRWTGHIPIRILLRSILDHEGQDPGLDVLVRMLKEGNADLVAESIVKGGLIHSSLIKALLHPHWSIRLGAMVTVEFVAEKARGLAARILPELWDKIDEVSTSVQGDILYVTGELADESWLPKLKAFLTTIDNDDLFSVGQEAMEKIRSRRE